MIGGGIFYRGPIRITISEGEGGEAGEQLTVRPKPDDELYTAESGPGGTDHAAGLASRLLAALVSEDGLRVWRYVAERGPVAAKVVPGACGVERSRCYVLLTDLRDRGLIADHGDGYELADKELWEAIIASSHYPTAS